MLCLEKVRINKYVKCILLLSIVVSFALSIVILPTVAVAEPEGYTNAKVELTRLLQDTKRGKYRHNWLSISDEFYEIYRNNANWNNRAAALYRSAKALDNMARRSYVRKDAQVAASRYEFLVKNHSTSPLADDALYASASIYNELLHNTNKSKELLTKISKKYAKSDYAAKAKTYLSQMNGTIVASLGNTIATLPTTETVALTQIDSQLRNDVVRIVISIDSMTSWRAKYFQNASGENPGVVITLKDVKPSQKISLEDEFKKSGIFTGYGVKYNPSIAQSVIVLKFSDLLRYTVKSEKSPARLIIEATNSKKELPLGITVKDEKTKKVNTARTSSTKKKAHAKKSVQISKPKAKFTKQIGARVKTIVIDPGHGGKDPGAMHNGLREKTINLDIAKRLANVLRSAGYKVFLTRTDDRYLALYQRTDIAIKHDADLFVSIHANAHAKSNVTGFETYYLDFRNDSNALNVAAKHFNVTRKNLDKIIKPRMQNSERLAKIVQHNALKKAKRDGYNIKNGGTRGAPFHVLIGSPMPSVLIEVGYSSNKGEAQRLRSVAYKNSIAEGIANGLHQYYSQVLQASR